MIVGIIDLCALSADISDSQASTQAEFELRLESSGYAV